MSEKRDIRMVCRAEDENENMCDTQLVESKHGKFIDNPRGEDRHGNRLEKRFEMGCIRLRCPNCGTEHHQCNMCYSEDSTPPGWYVGESIGEQIPCDNCNRQEVLSQERRGY